MKYTHSSRPIRFHQYWDYNDWKIKVYTIVASGQHFDDQFLQLAKTLAAPILDKARDHHGAAFITIHLASAFHQIILDWWAKHNELRHRVFKAQPSTPLDFVEVTESGEAFCIWELKVIGFEREQWIQQILLRKEPNFKTYYQQLLSADE